MSRIVEQFRDYINWSFALTVGIAIALFAWEPLKSVFAADRIKGALCGALLVATVARYFLYLDAVRTELDLIDRVLEAGEVYSVRGRVLPTVLFLAILFGILMASATRIVTYCVVSMCLSLVDLYGQATVNRNVAVRIVSGSVRARARETGLVDPLQAFYIERHLLLHAASFTAAGSLSLALAVKGTCDVGQQWANAAYVVMVVSIVIAEVVIFRWRRVRDTKLKDAIDGAARNDHGQ